MRGHPVGDRRGAILIWVLVAMVLLGSIISAGLMLAQSTSQEISLELAFRGQAMNVAQAGLVDAHSWFRRQLTQPVLVFDPKRDLLAVPAVNDTDDTAVPSTGIIREFEIGQTSQVWGRYEVLKVDVTDVTQQRNLPGAGGAAWRIRSRGFVYQRVNGAVPFNVLPNRVISQVVLEGEIQRMNIVPPADAAVCVRNASLVTVASKGRVQGNNKAALVYKAATGVPTTAGGEVTGSPAMQSLTPFLDSPTDVFGLTQAGIKSVSDDKFIYPGAPVPMGTWPSPIPTYHLMYVEGNLVFDVAKRLNGSGIIYVKGNVTVNAGSNSFFSGLMYVDGNLTLRAPCLLKGTFIVTGTVNIQGVGDYSEVEFDQNIREDLLSSMGQYRFSRPPVIVQQ